MEYQEKYKVIGLMSGTSLDGVDIACCIIKKKQDQWVYAIDVAQTTRYSAAWQKKLGTAHELDGANLMALDVEYGKFLGVLVQAFIMKNRLKGIDFVASHGHTVFHQPAKGFTFQLGNGHALHTAAGLPVVCDFRSLDVSWGGQGAPLVPIGDKLLFHEYDVCLNIGGIANLSREEKGKRVAFDICFANMGLNYLASLKGKSFDDRGIMASDGQVNNKMLQALSHVYQKVRKERPSLGREFFERNIKPLLDKSALSAEDRLCTFTESIAREIAESIPLKPSKNLTMLCTGGGVLNSFLMYRLVEQCGDAISVIVPDENIIKYKEALIFAFLGILRTRNAVNSLRSVTGAKKDSSGGIMVGF